MHVGEFEKVPMPPEDALRILRATADEDKGAVDLVRVLRSHPGISAAILRHANSPAYRFAGRIKTLDHAVPLLGTDTIRALALAAIRRESRANRSLNIATPRAI
jgi:HD-like signal output (HDOD) protein